MDVIWLSFIVREIRNYFIGCLLARAKYCEQPSAYLRMDSSGGQPSASLRIDLVKGTDKCLSQSGPCQGNRLGREQTNACHRIDAFQGTNKCLPEDRPLQENSLVILQDGPPQAPAVLLHVTSRTVGRSLSFWISVWKELTGVRK